MADPFTDNLITLLPNLKRFAMSLCRRNDVADDLVQITAERAFKAQEQFDRATRLEAWLFRIMRNAWIDMVRRNKTRGTEIDATDARDLPSFDGVRDIEAKLMLTQTNAALQELPEDQREVIVLVCMEQMTYSEASGILGIPAGTVMSRLSRGRIALAKKMGIEP